MESALRLQIHQITKATFDEVNSSNRSGPIIKFPSLFSAYLFDNILFAVQKTAIIFFHTLLPFPTVAR